MPPITLPVPRESADDGLARARPSAMGVDADAVSALLDDVEAAGLDLHALMLYRRGTVIADAWRWPYRADRPRNLHSVAKSFTTCAVGLAIDEGLLSLADRVVSFFPEADLGGASEWVREMTVEDLLTMRTGHAGETSGAVWRAIQTSWIDEFFRIPLAHRPGATFVYTSAASYMLSAIVTRVTGMTMHAYLKPRIFEPLGIRDETWELGPDGINPGGNGLVGKTVDMLKLGILHLERGMWNGRRLLSESWVESATRAQEASGRYGYQWWIQRGGTYAAVGKFVQMVKVFPEHDVALAVTGAIGHSAKLLAHVDRYFPAAFRAAPLSDDGADARLDARLASWQAPDAPAEWKSVFDDAPHEWRAGTVVDNGGPVTVLRYAMQPNAQQVDALALSFSADGCDFRLTDAHGTYCIVAGFDSWIEGRTDMPGRELHHGWQLPDSPVVARATWTDAATLQMVWIFPESAFRDTVICRFDGERIVFSRSVNINSGPCSYDDVRGTRVD